MILDSALYCSQDRCSVAATCILPDANLLFMSSLYNSNRDARHVQSVGNKIIVIKLCDFN